MTDGFKYIAAKGDASESGYPYSSSSGTAPTCSSSKSGGGVAAGVVTSYKDVAESEEALKEAVAQGPVSVGIEADQSAFQFYSSGVFDSTCGTNVDHGVLA